MLEWGIGHQEIMCRNTKCITVIWMFDLDFMNNLRQVLGDNLWLVKLTNQN